MRWIVWILLMFSFAAEAAPRYAIVSLIGDRLLLARAQPGVGSRMDRDLREFMPMPKPVFDHAAVFAVQDAIKAADADAGTVLLQVRDPKIYEAQEKALAEDRDAAVLLPALADVLAQAKATHLVLVSKQRREARIELPDGYGGTGTLEGIGFYIDSDVRVEDRANRQTAIGFVAPFAYMRIAVVDVAGGKLLAERRIAASKAAWDPHQPSPWDAMTDQDKARVMQALVREEILRAVPALLPR